MPIVRFRLNGSDAQVNAMIAALHELDHVDRVEEVADQMHDRDDTSSRGLGSDQVGDFHCIEAHAMSAKSAGELRDIVETAARDLSAAVEFVDRF